MGSFACARPSSHRPHLHSHLISITLRVINTVVLLALICGVAIAADLNAKAKACISDPGDLAGLSGDPGIDVNAVTNVVKTAAHLLLNEKFRELDCLTDSVRTSKERLAGGVWTLHLLYNGLRAPQLHPTEEDWKTHMALVQKWVGAKPKSITARVALAESYMDWGYNARGSGYSNTVSESGWRLFEERNRKAKRVLEEASKLPTQCPEQYLAMQNAITLVDDDASEQRAAFDRAIKFEPDYHYYYRIYTQYRQTKWGGEPGEVAKFMQQEADKLGGDAGDMMYFQTALNLVCGCQSDKELDLSWPRIKKGFAATENKYGKSLKALNQMASMAGSFNDAIAANDYFSRIGEQWDEEKWVEYKYFDRARQWAKQMTPYQQKLHEIEDIAEAHRQTQVGQQYKAAVDAKMRELIKSCLGLVTGEVDKFHWFVQVGKEGTIESISGPLTGPLGPCLGPKLKESYDKKEAVFPPPPEPSYWVRFDFDPADLAAVAAQ